MESTPTEAAALARIRERDLLRNAKERKRKGEVSSEQKRAGESVEDFADALKKKKAYVTTLIENAQESKDLPAYFEAVMAEIFKIQRYTAESTFFLPPYEIQQARSLVAHLQQQASKRKAELIPRKKFRFRSSKKNQKRQSTQKKINVSTEAEVRAKIDEESESGLGGSSSSSSLERTMFTIQDKKHEQIRFGSSSGEISNKNIKLNNLQNTEVTMLSTMNTIRLTDLKGCQLYAGPVSGPVYIERCQNCIFYLTCRQLRVHEVTDCKFYLNIASKPIIENCKAVGVSTYNLTYPEHQNHLKTAGFDSQPNCWNQVCDFNWLRSQKSPNWYVIGEDIRDKLPKHLQVAAST